MKKLFQSHIELRTTQWIQRRILNIEIQWFDENYKQGFIVFFFDFFKI